MFFCIDFGDEEGSRGWAFTVSRPWLHLQIVDAFDMFLIDLKRLTCFFIMDSPQREIVGIVPSLWPVLSQFHVVNRNRRHQRDGKHDNGDHKQKRRNEMKSRPSQEIRSVVDECK